MDAQKKSCSTCVNANKMGKLVYYCSKIAQCAHPEYPLYVAEKLSQEPPVAQDETVIVSAKALMAVLSALNGPDHWIRELQATRSLDTFCGKENPINQLNREYDEQIIKNRNENFNKG